MRRHPRLTATTPTLPKVETMQPEPIRRMEWRNTSANFTRKHLAVSTAWKMSVCATSIFLGPRQDPSSPYSGVLAKFCSGFLDGTPPAVFGDGEQSRDFTYVDNAVAANLLACEAPNVSGKVFNIGTGVRRDVE